MRKLKTVVIPAKNVKDLADIPEEIQEGLAIHPCEHVEQVLKIALDLISLKNSCRLFHQLLQLWMVIEEWKLLIKFESIETV